MYRLYEAVFNGKVEHFKGHPGYETMRKNADWCLINHKGYGYNSIKAADFMDRIICMPLEYIEEYLNGRNRLEWTNAVTGERYNSESEFSWENTHVINAINRQLPFYGRYLID